jgi:hypothetical protein
MLNVNGWSLDIANEEIRREFSRTEVDGKMGGEGRLRTKRGVIFAG